VVQGVARAALGDEQLFTRDEIGHRVLEGAAREREQRQRARQ
jgi:hypothetical protein